MGNTLTFAASRAKVLLILLISICFVALGVWLTPQRPILGWLVTAFFGLGIVVSPLMLLPNSTYLRLDEEGFEMGSFIRNQKFKWTDVADFRLGSIHGTKIIAIIFRPEYKQLQRGRAVAAALSGMEAAIPNHYNATLEQVLEALTTWKERFGRKHA